VHPLLLELENVVLTPTSGSAFRRDPPKMSLLAAETRRRPSWPPPAESAESGRDE